MRGSVKLAMPDMLLEVEEDDEESFFDKLMPDVLQTMRGQFEDKEVNGELIEKYNAEEIVEEYMSDMDIATRVLKVFAVNNDREDLEELLGMILDMDINKDEKEKYWDAGKTVFKGNKQFKKEGER